jgi:Pathogenicity locus
MVAKLTDLPNIGKAIAADLMSIGIDCPEDLEGRNMCQTYLLRSIFLMRKVTDDANFALYSKSTF